MYFKLVEYFRPRGKEPCTRMHFRYEYAFHGLHLRFQGFFPCSFLGWTPSRAALCILHSISSKSTPSSFLPYSSLHGVVGVLGHINTEGLITYARSSGLLGSALYDAFSHNPTSIFRLLDFFLAGSNIVALGISFLISFRSWYYSVRIRGITDFFSFDIFHFSFFFSYLVRGIAWLMCLLQPAFSFTT
ncbi:hypothetical protein AOQ84DRAFT_8612 [Glonium stellatum]|uniref:Uncharacterized protein n=1 Tax=Glonium stellatum TaxID=574774 RepID=A0A8E2JUC5_9PEZI|nr:hypothetical protein AOQ84DRAFT_8612 [Glonium stellatum]